MHTAYPITHAFSPTWRIEMPAGIIAATFEAAYAILLTIGIGKGYVTKFIIGFFPDFHRKIENESTVLNLRQQVTTDGILIFY